MKNNMLVLDVGGTWLRAGIYTQEGKIIEPKKVRIQLVKTHAINQKLKCLVNNILKLVQNYNSFSFDIVSISLGACINHFTGEIYFSAPLLGSEQIGVNFKEIIANRLYPKYVVMINDLTALCYGYDMLGYAKNLSEYAVITISSGIAMRRYNVKSKSVYLDNKYGIQGEIGHLAVFNPYAFADSTYFKCDCGEYAHFAAYSSGKGLDNIFENLSYDSKQFINSSLGKAYAKSKNAVLALKEIIEYDFRLVESYLDLMAYPIAHAVSTIIYICPEMEKLYISGGVIEGLSKHLIEKIFYMLSKISYVYNELFYHQKLVFMEEDINLGLIGAGYYASLYLKLDKL